MSYRKRLTGADLTDETPVAVEKQSLDGLSWEHVGYARSEQDADLYIEQSTDSSSHSAFFAKKPLDTQKVMQRLGQSLAADDEQDVRQSSRRIAAFREMFENVITNRVSPGSSPDLYYTTFEEFTKMQAEYKDAVQAGDGKNFPFQPLSAYHQKLIRRDGKVLRPILQNEVGMWTNHKGEAKIVVLKDQGPGDLGGKYFKGADLK